MSEVSPNHQYRRRDIVSEQGPHVTYNAIDLDEGTEVLWHELSIQSQERAAQYLYPTVKTLRAINHRNIIRVYYAWVDGTRKCVVLISEMGSETLRNYVATVATNPSPEMITNWCSQIIAALEELHANGIQHRALTCDHIFFDSSDGTVKVGLPELDVPLYGATLPLAAPEADTVRDPGNDIWLFGLCVIELCTGTIPYSELSNYADIREKISDHQAPMALKYVADPLIADLIVNCLLPIEQRPTASQISESDLFCSFGGDVATPRRSQDDSSGETSARQKPEFVAMLQRHNMERQELLERQKQARHALRVRIRERQNHSSSLKRLLND